MDRLDGTETIAFPGQGRQFDIRQPHAERAGVRDDKQQENHYSQTSDKMSGRPPELQAFRQRLHICQYGGPCSRISRHTLEPCIDQGVLPSPQDVRQHSEYERQKPGQNDDHEAVLKRDGRSFPDENEREDTYYERDDEADGKRPQCRILPVHYRNYQGKEHEQRTDQQRLPDIPGNDLDIHTEKRLKFLGRR